MSKSPYSCDCTIIHHEAVETVRQALPEAEILDAVASFFKVLGDPTRVRIMWALERRELCVCDLANVLDMTKSAVSHQLGTLRRARLVKCRREGKTVFYSLDDGHVKGMLDAGFDHVHK